MIPLNLQPAEKQKLRSDGMLDVIGCWLTLQGEGPYAGTPAVFVRLAGCSLLCPQCDTGYTEGRTLQGAEELTANIFAKAGPAKLVVLTGGEPFRQNCLDLCRRLRLNGIRVQVETNGTIFASWASAVNSVVCSPKTSKLNSDILHYISAYKYILSVDEVDPEDGLPLSSLGMNGRPARPHEGFQGEVFVQPLDEQDITRNALHAKACVESCLKYGYRLSWQLHKDLGLS